MGAGYWEKDVIGMLENVDAFVLEFRCFRLGWWWCSMLRTGDLGFIHRQHKDWWVCWDDGRLEASA